MNIWQTQMPIKRIKTPGPYTLIANASWKYLPQSHSRETRINPQHSPRGPCSTRWALALNSSQSAEFAKPCLKTSDSAGRRGVRTSHGQEAPAAALEIVQCGFNQLLV